MRIAPTSINRLLALGAALLGVSWIVVVSPASAESSAASISRFCDIESLQWKVDTKRPIQDMQIDFAGESDSFRMPVSALYDHRSREEIHASREKLRTDFIVRMDALYDASSKAIQEGIFQATGIKLPESDLVTERFDTQEFEYLKGYRRSGTVIAQIARPDLARMFPGLYSIRSECLIDLHRDHYNFKRTHCRISAFMKCTTTARPIVPATKDDLHAAVCERLRSCEKSALGHEVRQRWLEDQKIAWECY